MDAATISQIQVRTRCQQLNIQYIQIESNLIRFCVQSLMKRYIVDINRAKSKKSDQKICFVSPKDSEKTSIMHKLLCLDETINPTVKNSSHLVTDSFQLFDTVGLSNVIQQGLVWYNLSQFFEQEARLHLFVIVFDCSQNQSEELAYNCWRILRIKQISNNSILIIANKSQKQQYRQKSRYLKRIWRQRNVQYLEIHINDQNIKEKVNVAIWNCIIYNSYNK